jgi:hypothetical protein
MDAQEIWQRLKDLVLKFYEGGPGYCGLSTLANDLIECAGEDEIDWLAELSAEFENDFVLVRRQDEQIKADLLYLARHRPVVSVRGVEVSELIAKSSVKFAPILDADENTEHLGIIANGDWLRAYCRSEGVLLSMPENARDILKGTWGVLPASVVAYVYCVPADELHRFIACFSDLMNRCNEEILLRLVAIGEKATEDRIEIHKTLDAIAEADGELSSS